MRQRGVSSFTHLLMSYWFCCVSWNFGFGCLNLTEDLIFANDFQMIYEFFLALIFDVVQTSCSTPQPGCFVFCSIYDTMYSDTTYQYDGNNFNFAFLLPSMSASPPLVCWTDDYDVVYDHVDDYLHFELCNEENVISCNFCCSLT